MTVGRGVFAELRSRYDAAVDLQQYADGLAERLPVAPELFGTLLPAGLMLLLVRQLDAIG